MWVESDVLVSIVSVVYGWEEGFDGNGGVCLGIMIGFEVDVEGEFWKVVVVEDGGELEWGCV